MTKSIFLLNKTGEEEWISKISNSLSKELNAWGYTTNEPITNNNINIKKIESNTNSLNGEENITLLISDDSIISDSTIFKDISDLYNSAHPIDGVIIVGSSITFKYHNYKYWFSPMCYVFFDDLYNYGNLVHFLLSKFSNY